MKRRCFSLGALLVLVAVMRGVSPLFGASEPRPRLQETPQLVDILLTYHLNDREKPPSACRMVISSAGEVVEPKVTAGGRYWFEPRRRPNARSSQRPILKCDGYVAAVSVAAPYDLLKGRISVALAVFSPPDRILQPEPEYPFQAPADERFLGGGLHLEGRKELREEWERLPALMRKSIRAAFVLMVSDGATVIMSPGYR